MASPYSQTVCPRAEALASPGQAGYLRRYWSTVPARETRPRLMSA